MFHRVIAVLLAASVGLLAAASAQAEGAQKFDVAQTVVALPVDEGLTPQDVAESIMSKAQTLNMKFVGRQPLSQELQARGMESRHLEIFQFCNPMDARRMVDFNPIFAAYMPCRIVVVEDPQGKLWVEMINLDMLIENTALPPDVKEIAEGVNQTLTAIMEAGAHGDF